MGGCSMPEDKIPYRVVTVKDLADMLHEMSTKSSWEIACELLVKHELLILKKDRKEQTSEPNIKVT